MTSAKPVALYDEWVASSGERDGSRLGLIRLRAEAGLTLCYSIDATGLLRPLQAPSCCYTGVTVGGWAPSSVAMFRVSSAMTVFVAMEESSEPRVLRTCGLPLKALGCASLILSACSSPAPRTPPKVDCGLTTTDASCIPNGGAGGQSALDLPPVAKIRFNTLPPTGPNDYPYAPDALPTDAPQPRAGLYLSAADSFDPAGHAISFFWNVQDPTGKYLAVEPEPTAARVSVSTPGVGRYAISLAVVDTLAGPKADARVTPPLCSRNLSYVNEYLESIV